jgi:tRNA (guanine37-N1)-methyltransferase
VIFCFTSIFFVTNAGVIMKIDILTLFPEMFDSPFNASIVKRAQEKGLVEINTVNIRQFALNKHLQVDDYPYGGGAGMVLKADVLGEAIENSRTEGSWVIYMSPQGKLLDQAKVKEIAGKKHLIILCGHYEGVDERVMDVVDEEISIGDYILTGGELPAMVLVDAVVRLIPGVLGDRLSAQEESFSHKLLEYPHYTRPAAYKGKKVPEVLLSGHHEKIRLWRKKQSLLSTLLKRPELLLDREYDEEERALLEEILFSGGSKE